MFAWFWSLLKLLGLFSSIDGKVVLLGLDNAGKTTLLYRLKNNRLISPEPTERVNEETIEIGNCSLTAIDIGGHLLARKLWEQYYMSVQCIVFVVDSSDKSRFEEARVELNVRKLVLFFLKQCSIVIAFANSTIVENFEWW